MLATPLVVGRGYRFEVNMLGKIATWVLYASIAFMMLTAPSTDWPLVLFWIGLGLAIVSRARLRAEGSRRGRAVRAVVMAGGEGTRLRPLTSNQPKPMVPIVGKPCMEHILELLREHGFTDVVITLAFLPQAIRSHFGDGSNWGLNIEYSVEETPLGTAGSVRLASGRLEETTLIISGDALCDIDLTQLDAGPQGQGRGRHDRAQVGREPARVRDRRHRRGRPRRALPREAVVGAGLLATRSTPAST